MKRLTKDEAIQQLEKNPSLGSKELENQRDPISSSDLVDMEAGVEKILSKNPDVAKILKVRSGSRTPLRAQRWRGYLANTSSGNGDIEGCCWIKWREVCMGGYYVEPYATIVIVISRTLSLKKTHHRYGNWY
jgi:hypothetical protein